MCAKEKILECVASSFVCQKVTFYLRGVTLANCIPLVQRKKKCCDDSFVVLWTGLPHFVCELTKKQTRCGMIFHDAIVAVLMEKHLHIPQSEILIRVENACHGGIESVFHPERERLTKNRTADVISIQPTLDSLLAGKNVRKKFHRQFTIIENEVLS